MTRRMLIDAGHREETRVVVTEGKDLKEFDVESATRSQLKGNIYLAKVTRVEPALQAAFIEYGGNRHGFLAYNDIHFDYFQIPVADREELAAEQGPALSNAPCGTRKTPAPMTKPKPRPGTRERRTESPPPPRMATPSGRARRPANNAAAGGAAARNDDVRGVAGHRAPCRHPSAGLQDPGGHQAAPDIAGPGRQGGTRHQGRGAHHLSLDRRSLQRADAQHATRRRHFTQDLGRPAAQASQGHRTGPGGPRRHGRDHPHRRTGTHQGGDQARPRKSSQAMGKASGRRLWKPPLPL